MVEGVKYNFCEQIFVDYRIGAVGVNYLVLPTDSGSDKEAGSSQRASGANGVHIPGAAPLMDEGRTPRVPMPDRCMRHLGRSKSRVEPGRRPGGATEACCVTLGRVRNSSTLGNKVPRSFLQEQLQPSTPVWSLPS